MPGTRRLARLALSPPHPARAGSATAAAGIGAGAVGERRAVLAELHSERFVDCSPAQVWATLLDEGTYLASQRTMYRLLEANGELSARRDQLTHPPYQRPELLAEQPNEVWSWDISKLKGPAKWTSFYLHADLALKEQALARTKPPDTKPGRYRPPDTLLAFLEAL